MAKEMKSLNGYEIVDKTARDRIDSKQNKVLYGSGNPSSSAGINGDLYITSVDENSILDLIVPRHKYHSNGYSNNISNVDNNSLLILHGSGNSSYYFGVIGYDQIQPIVSNGEYDSNIKYDANTKTLTLPTDGWYNWYIFR